ncbi:DUF2381 family protein [Archangium gephyra]|uniref:DUF2381 family protein n=1 Tax=Archangium gephyra TaxID=48 RepID=UPI0035D48E04
MRPLPAALALLLLLASTSAGAQPGTPAGEAVGEPRAVVLSPAGQGEVPEVRIRPDLLTTLLFGAPLRLARVEVEERERFSRVTVLEDMLALIPSTALGAGKQLRLTVRFVEGTRPASADFLLVVDASRAEPQVNVELRPPVPDACWTQAEAERVMSRQCQAELARMRQRPDGITGLLATGQLDATGITTRELVPGRDFTQRPGEPLKVWKATSYRARDTVALEMEVSNVSTQPWTAAGAVLVGEDGTRRKVLRVWPLEPIAPGAKSQRVVVEAEAPEAQGRFTLLLWQDGEPPSVSLEGVTFP